MQLWSEYWAPMLTYLVQRSRSAKPELSLATVERSAPALTSSGSSLVVSADLVLPLDGTPVTASRTSNAPGFSSVQNDQMLQDDESHELNSSDAKILES
jgi:hypothetical protein